MTDRKQVPLPGLEALTERRPWRWRAQRDRDLRDLAELRRLQEALGISRAEVEALKRKG